MVDLKDARLLRGDVVYRADRGVLDLVFDALIEPPKPKVPLFHCLLCVAKRPPLFRADHDRD